MKRLFTSAPMLAVALLAAQLCTAAETASVVSPGAAAAKNSFREVTAQLEPGGDLYVYFSTEQLTSAIGDKIAKIRQVFSGVPGVGDTERGQINKVFEVVADLVKDSGIEDVSGFGASAVMRPSGFYHNKFILHHYKGKGSGFLWTMFGHKPHALASLDLLPADTVLAYSGDVDLPLLWSVIHKEVAKAGVPEADDMLAKLPAEFESATGLKWEKVLGSLGGEFGFALMLDDSHKITLPIPGVAMEIPEPSLMLVVKVNDDTLFNRLEELMKQAGQDLVVVDKPDLKMRTLPLPLPLPIQLRPTIASSHGYLLIANSDNVIQQALAAKAGEAKGLKSTDEFKRLSTDVPLQGNHFSFVSPRLGQTLLQVQQEAMKMVGGSSGQGADALKSLLGSDAAACGFSVSANTDEGWLAVGNGNQHPAKVILAATVVPVAVGAAMVLPALAKAKERAQQISCAKNLRQLETAKRAWALEEKKGDSDTPTREELTKRMEKFPACPSGGSYTINSMGQAPECSISGHVLKK